MAWFQKVSLGNLQDLAGAVTKISESVKNIEKNFDSALGLEERHDENSEGSASSTSDATGFFNPVMSLIGQKGDDVSSLPPANLENTKHLPVAYKTQENRVEELSTSKVAVEDDKTLELAFPADVTVSNSDENQETQSKKVIDSENMDVRSLDSANHSDNVRSDPQADASISFGKDVGASNFGVAESAQAEKLDSMELVVSELHSTDSNTLTSEGGTSLEKTVEVTSDTQHQIINYQDCGTSPETETALYEYNIDHQHSEAATNGKENDGVSAASSGVESHTVADEQNAVLVSNSNFKHDLASDHSKASLVVDASSFNEEKNSHVKDFELKEHKLSDPNTDAAGISDSSHEVEKLRQEMEMMGAALQGAAKQAQAKADEIARMTAENEQLKLTIDDLKRKSSEAEMDALKEEYHQRVSSLERKVYALTKERDTLKREQNKKTDAAALLREKDEIITQVMAEGEELSKRQAAQEATMRKLRAQIRELEEEKQKLNSKLQVEETKVESLKRDKAATEKVLQETIERNQAELAAQKEFYTNALNAAKEAEALAEARVNSEAKLEMENRIKEAGEKEAILLQTLEELRHMLSRKEQEAAFREEMLKRDFGDLQKRYQASELRYNELVTQVPESTRPLLRQIEAMQETAARRAEAWAGVESALNSRLQEAEAKAAAAEERERLMNERLLQSASRITVLETQIAILRTEQTQLSRSLEKERQRASESRQEYLAIKEEAATQEGRARQLEDEIKELRVKQRKELLEAAEHRDLLEKELAREKSFREELEKASREKVKTYQEPTRNVPPRRLSSVGSVEESNFVQSSLDTSDSILPERRMSGEISSYHLKSMTPNAFEIALRQKDGELASYISRLASLESIRDSLAEELVNMTEQCEKFRAEAATLPGIKAELEALKQRHLQALELMGERDEALEELRNDIDDVKEMYREQVDFLVNKINMLTARD